MATKPYKPIPPNSAVEVGISGRKTQFFLPGDGIDREVIQGDICRYLDHDATVKPGEFNQQTGFFIFAYRNLTTEQIKDIKVDSTKLQKEREDKKERFKQEQRKRQQSNKRKLESHTQVPYADSKTHTQSILRYEEREQQRTSAHSPAPGPALDYALHSPPIGLPTPMPSQRGDPGYAMPPPQAQPVYTSIAPQSHYPRGTTTPESAYSQGSSEPRIPQEHRPVYDEDAYSNQSQSPAYGYASPPLPQQPPIPVQAVAGRTFQPPLTPLQHQQMQRNEPRRSHEPLYNSYNDDPMDDRMDDRMDVRMDDRMDEDPVDHRMPPPRMDSRAPPYGSMTIGGLEGVMDTRMGPPPRMQSRMDPPRTDYRTDERDYHNREPPREHRPEPRMDARAGTSVGMRPDPTRDYRSDPRIDHRAGTSVGMRSEPYAKREEPPLRYDELRDSQREAQSGYRDRDQDRRQQGYDDRRRGRGRG